MSTKNLKILSAVFIVLLGIAAFPLFRQEVENVIKPQQKGDTLFNESVDLNEISMIDISLGQDRLEFKRHSDGWRVNEKKADTTELEKLVADFNDMTVGDLVSKNPDNHASYGVSQDKGIFLKMNSQNNDYAVYVGNLASSGAFYVRKDGSDEVYIAKSNLKNNLSIVPSMWRDKRIADINSEDITKIEYTGKRNFTLEKNLDVWQYKWSWRTEDLTLEEADKFRNIFSPMVSSSFADEEEAEAFEKAWNKSNIKVYNKEDLILELSFIEQEPEEEGLEPYLHIKNITEDSDVFEVGSYVIQGVTEYLDR